MREERMSAAEWLGQFQADATPLEMARVAEARQDARDAVDAKRAEAERQAAAERRLETLTFAERQFGNPLAEMSRARSAFTEADDVYRDLRDQLRKAEAKRDRAKENVEFWAQRVGQAQEAVSRSAPSGGVEGAVSRAQEALRHAAAEKHVDAMLAQASARAASRSASPPKAPAAHHDGCAVCQGYAASRAAAPAREVTRVTEGAFG
jgi:hypothetical protein